MCFIAFWMKKYWQVSIFFQIVGKAPMGPSWLCLLCILCSEWKVSFNWLGMLNLPPEDWLHGIEKGHEPYASANIIEAVFSLGCPFAKREKMSWALLVQRSLPINRSEISSGCVGFYCSIMLFRDTMLMPSIQLQWSKRWLLTSHFLSSLICHYYFNFGDH